MAYPNGKICKQETCEKPLRARGYCSTHYGTFMRETLNSTLSLGERISMGRLVAERKKTNARISAAKTGQKYTRRKTNVKKPNATGSFHWNWKGGKKYWSTTIRRRNLKDLEKHSERARFSYTVRLKVLQRDNYTCQICDQYNGKLTVDHIKSWKAYPELRFDPDNCRTICMTCHYYVTFKRKLPNGTVWGYNYEQ